MSTFTEPLEVEYIDGRTWKLIAAFDYVLDWKNEASQIINVPAGFVTDFASIPRALWDILPPTGKYGKAAVIHDYLYVNGGNLPPDQFSKTDADRIFYEAMGILGVGQVTRYVMWQAVKVFGKGAFK
jgi:hypothetical protein